MDAFVKTENDSQMRNASTKSLRMERCQCTTVTAMAPQVSGRIIPRHTLPLQVHQWTVEDVALWLSKIGFLAYVDQFEKCQVDGDILLRVTNDDLLRDLGMTSSIVRERFMRELRSLKIQAGYFAIDPTGLIMQNVRGLLSLGGDSYDVFISYRRSSGSHLASLLKLRLQSRGFSVFLDVDRLPAGKFGEHLLSSIRRSKHFVLVLTDSALDRCLDDSENEDWVHKEIATALACGLNIVPVADNFKWPALEDLPEDMKSIVQFNSVGYRNRGL